MPIYKYEPFWTLSHESGAWVLRYGSGSEHEVRATNGEIEPDLWGRAQDWGTRELADNHGVTVATWSQFRPGLLPYPTHWIARETTQECP